MRMKTETAQAAYGGTTEGGPAAQLSRMAEIVHGAGAAMRGSGRREAEADTRESGRREAEADTREGGRREAEAVRRDGGARSVNYRYRTSGGTRTSERGRAREISTGAAPGRCSRSGDAGQREGKPVSCERWRFYLPYHVWF